MEPLSLASNIIAVISAAKSVAKGLEKKTKLRHTPNHLLQLSNEVSDFRVVLGIVEELDRVLKHDGHYIEAEHHLASLIKKAGEVSSQISLELLLTQSSEPRTIIRSGWIRNHAFLEQISKKMKEIRVEITDALTLVNAAEISHLRVSLSNVSLNHSHLNDRIMSAEVAVNDLRPTLIKVQGMVQKVRPYIRQLQQTSFTHSMENSAPAIRVHASIEKSCTSLCQCNCHQFSVVSTPTWLKGLIGLLFVGYAGIPIPSQKSRPCSENLCSRNKSPLLKVNYYFPSWFLSRMIALRDRWTPLDGHSLTVRTPRVTRSYSLFNAVKTGHLAQVQKLFAEGKASPFDVNEFGVSALIYAVEHRKLDICKFLLNEYADVEHEDVSLRSAVDTAIINTLIPINADESRAIYDLLKKYIDPLENVRNLGFTLLHQIVLNLSSLDLRSQLDVSTQAINMKDSMGFTPLYWAVRISNTSALEILLEYGASLEQTARPVSLFNFRTFGVFEMDDNTSAFSLACGGMPAGRYRGQVSACQILQKPAENPTQCDTCDLDFLRSVFNMKNDDSTTPLSWVAWYNLPNLARMLLGHGAVVDFDDDDFRSRSRPLLIAVQNNSHEVLEILLQWSKLDVKNTEARNVLHIAGCSGDLESMNILISSKISLSTYNEGDVYGRTPLECFDTDRLEHRNEDEKERLECREAFLKFIDISKSAAFEIPPDEWARLCEMEIGWEC